MTYIDSALFGIFVGCGLTTIAGVIAEYFLGINVTAIGFGTTIFVMSFMLAVMMEADTS